MIMTMEISHNKEFFIEDIKYFFLSYQQKFFVVKDICPHRGGPLSKGDYDIKTGVITCPWHETKVCAENIINKALPAVQIGNLIFAVTHKEN